MRTFPVVVSAVLLLASTAAAQWGRGSVATRRADIRGGGGDRGKCTIEVEVDDVAEIEIRGDTGRMRTLSGQPAAWRRFECNSVMPSNPSDFRFRGIDGRGRQELVSDPRDRGAAVVRIEDPKGGREGYTFDIEWRGGSSFGGGGNWGGGNWGNNNWNDEMSFRGRGDGYYRNARGQSDRLRNCRVDVSRRGDVEVTFDTDRSYSISLRGRLTRTDRDRLIADMSGNGINGSMMILLNGRNRVREISMAGAGRDRFELRWNE